MSCSSSTLSRRRCSSASATSPAAILSSSKSSPARWWRERPTPRLGLPTSVVSIISARLDALPARERRLLMDASVIGRVFWPSMLEALDPSPWLDEALASLNDSRVHPARARLRYGRRRRVLVSSRLDPGGGVQHAAAAPSARPSRGGRAAR